MSKPGSPAAWVERVTSTTLFAVFLGISVMLAGLLLLVGLAFLPTLLLSAGSAWSWIPLFLLAGGLLGLVGLVRGRGQSSVKRTGKVELTIVCLAMGIAAAVVVVAYVGFALSETRPSVLTLSLGAMFAVPHAILILAGMGAIQRLKRRYAAEAGQPFDTLPVIFLLVSLGLALGAVMAAGLGP